METINSPYDPLTRDSYDTFVEKVRMNMVEIYSLLLNGAAMISTKSLNLDVSVAELTISGSSFSKPLTKQPTLMRAMYKDGSNNIIDVSEIIARSVLNGNVYDVIITPIEDAMTNVTISII